MAAPKIIRDLVERFDRNRDAYRAGHYNETQIRREFIDPFFKALGWDMDNEQGYAEAYKDVIHEDAIRIGSAMKAPDYGFRIGGTRKFFLEAKKPSVDIKDDPGPAYQLRRYAWSAKLPLSILTDFEEFAVYDCRIRPDKDDKSSAARILYLNYTEYAEKWDEIAAKFSHEAVLKGSFDKYAETSRLKKGTAQVDDAFLAEIESWRNELAHNIALRNGKLSNRDLNFAVQMTIDRIIFLRICEDRGVERYGELQSLLNGEKVYRRLLGLFEKADDRYNSGLFHLKADKDRPEGLDELTPTLVIDDKVLKEIFKGLYYPESPYAFSVLPTEILGQVYEQFLGKVIRLTSGHQAKVEDKPEVKKAGGVFYTPAYIVDYIVQNTVGKLIEGKTPKEVEKIKILDPACGSGSFLLGAYQFLLKWHLDWYLANDPAKWAKGKRPPVCSVAQASVLEVKQSSPGAIPDINPKQGRFGYVKLTLDERKKILLNNIFGVDIDTQAVEVTKLSLLLKVLEGEKDLSLFASERALPDLGQNIKCGNSLIGPDFYHNQQGMMFDDDEQKYKINAFDWQAEFKDIFSRKNGGFDAVIGNPPWGGDIDSFLNYFHRKFPSSTLEHTDSFKLFIEQALNLSSKNALISMIVPNTLLRQRRLKDVRSLLLKKSIVSIIDLGENVFENVVAPSCVFVIANHAPEKINEVKCKDVSSIDVPEKPSRLFSYSGIQTLKQSMFLANADYEFMPSIVSESSTVTSLGTFPLLLCKDAGINYQRINVGMQEKGKSDLSSRLLYEGDREEHPADKMYWKGADINRFYIEPQTNRFCRTNYQKFIKSNEVVHLSKEVYSAIPKILIRQTADKIIGTIDYKGIWFGRSIIAILMQNGSNYSVEYFLGLLNSKYLNAVYQSITKEAGRVFAQVKLSKIKQLPIRAIDFSNKTDKTFHDKMVSLVEGMIELHKKLALAKTPNEKTVLQRQITATDEQIDRLVYELYGLTEEEIKLVEEAGK